MRVETRVVDDLIDHYGKRVRQAVLDGEALLSDPADRGMFSLSLTAIPLAAAAVQLAETSRRAGRAMTNDQAVAALLKVLLVGVEEGEAAGAAAFRNAVGPI